MTARRTILTSGPAVLAAGLFTRTDDRGNQHHPPLTNYGSEEPAIYLFTQQHRDALPWWEGTWRPQQVASGARLRIQLPGDPIQWVPHTGDGCQRTPWPDHDLVPEASIELEDHTIVPSPGRIEGTDSLYQFDYRVHGEGTAVACLRPDPPPEHPEDLAFPPGSPLNYVLTVLVTR